MSGYKQVRTSISYITGEIRLEFVPPHGFIMEPRVEVDDVPSHIAPLEGGTATAWIYLAMVKAGNHEVRATVGNVEAEDQVKVEEGSIAHLDFVFEKGA